LAIIGAGIDLRAKRLGSRNNKQCLKAKSGADGTGHFLLKREGCDFSHAIVKLSVREFLPDIFFSGDS
jgi:hypothetical protein